LSHQTIKPHHDWRGQAHAEQRRARKPQELAHLNPSAARPWYTRLLHPDARLSSQQAAASNSVIYLANAKYLLLESQRTDGTAAGAPMWFAAVDDTIYLRTRADSPTARRIRRHSAIKVAACTMRGMPFGDYIECSARIVPEENRAEAAAALRRSCGTIRRLLLNTLARSDHVYLEATPLRPTPHVASPPITISLVPNARDDDTPPGAA
jgi:PPOX class probable F420-dependent enzyme